MRSPTLIRRVYAGSRYVDPALAADAGEIAPLDADLAAFQLDAVLVAVNTALRFGRGGRGGEGAAAAGRDVGASSSLSGSKYFVGGPLTGANRAVQMAFPEM